MKKIILKLVVLMLLLLGMAIPVQAVTYSYDELNRLETITYDQNNKITYVYDDAGNIIEVISTAKILKSTYQIIFGDLTGTEIVAGDTLGTVLPVSLVTNRIGQTGYESVRVNVSVDGPGTAQLLAIDTQGNTYDVAQIGYWGPESGFPLPGEYNVTTDFTGKFSEAGTYTIEAVLYNLATNQPITSSVLTVEVREAVPGVSTYAITFGDLTGISVIAGDEEGTVLPVTLAADQVGQTGYESVRVNVSVDGPGTAQLLATDTQGNTYDVAQIGYWGPESGFPLPSEYNVTTDFTGKFSEAGTYTIEAALYDLATSQPITSSILTIEVREVVPGVSTYAITFGDLIEISVVAGDEEGTVLPVALETNQIGQTGYESVRVNVTVDGPGTAQLLATDTQGNTYDVAQIGYWGPESGFPLPSEYNVTTDFTGKFSEAGTYTIEAVLYNLATNQPITSSVLTVEVRETEPGVSTYAITFGDLTGISVIAGDEEGTVLPVTLSADQIGQTGYESVRINVSVDGPGTAQLLATDTQGNTYDVAQIGHWGPESGFPLPGEYNVTTDFTGKFSEAGTYTIEAVLYDLATNQPITSSVLTVEVKEAEPGVSTYAITFGDLTGISVIAGDEEGTALPVTLTADQVGQTGYETVRVNVSVDGPGTAQLLATDTQGNTYDVAQIGYWGPEAGFPLPNEYDVTTDFIGKFNEAGTYAIEVVLYDLATDQPITSSILSVQVNSN